jgi:hypothetical protein
MVGHPRPHPHES